MPVDEDLLAAARTSQARVVECERAVDLARAEFRYAVRRLHLAGASLREVGDALNLSHQRVHQLVEEAEGSGRGWRSYTARAERRELACSFCGKPQKEVRRLIAGPGYVAICETCTDKAGQVLGTGKVAATRLSSITPLPAVTLTGAPGEPLTVAKCSFCSKGRHQVAGLAAGPGDVSVCDECLALCNEIIADA